jgi:hypothetical protein
MDDPLNPRPTPGRDHEPNERWREMQDRDYGYMGPVIALVAALFVGLLIYSMWGSDQTNNTQVGQNVERTTPDTPRNPNTPK